MEDYRYSRLSQNEIDVDSIQFNHPLHEGGGSGAGGGSGGHHVGDHVDEEEEEDEADFRQDECPFEDEFDSFEDRKPFTDVSYLDLHKFVDFETCHVAKWTGFWLIFVHNYFSW